MENRILALQHLIGGFKVQCSEIKLMCFIVPPPTITVSFKKQDYKLEIVFLHVMFVFACQTILGVRYVISRIIHALAFIIL